MTHVSSFFKRMIKRIFLLGVLASMVSILSFTVGVSPSFADHFTTDTAQQRPLASEQATANRSNRVEAYEREAGILEEPDGLEKEYEDNLATYRKNHPSENSVLEEAKEFVEKVTGNENQ